MTQAYLIKQLVRCPPVALGRHPCETLSQRQQPSTYPYLLAPGATAR